MEKFESTPKASGDSMVNDFQKNQITSCCQLNITNANQIQLKTTSYDMKDFEPNWGFQNGDHLVPGDSSGANSHQCETSNNIENENVDETSYNSLQVVDQLVPSETSNFDMEIYGMSDTNENCENSHWLKTSQNNLEDSASNALEAIINDQLTTIISNGDVENIYHPETSHFNFENGSSVLLEVSNNDQLMPIVSNDHLEVSDHFVSESLVDAIKSTDHFRLSTSNKETNRHNSQLVPEIPNVQVDRNNQFFPQISGGNMENIDHISEDLSFGVVDSDQPQSYSSDWRSNLSSEQPSVVDFCEENEQSKFELLSACLKEDDLLALISDSQSDLSELRLNNIINDQTKSELSDVDYPFNYDETSNFDMRNAGQSSPKIQDSNLENYGQSILEIQDSNLEIDAPSSSETSDSNVRNYDKKKLEHSEKEFQDNDHSEAGPSVNRHEYLTPTTSTANEKSSKIFHCDRSNFSQSNNHLVLTERENYESITYSQASCVSHYLHPIDPEDQLSYFTDDFFVSGTPLMRSISSPPKIHTSIDSLQDGQSNVQKICADKDDMQHKQSESSEICLDKDDMQYKQSESSEICPDKDDMQYKQSESSEICPDKDDMQYKQSESSEICPDKDGVQYKQSESSKIYQDLDRLQYKQSESLQKCSQIDMPRNQQENDVRQRVVLKYPNVKDTNYSKPLSNSETEQLNFWKLKHLSVIIIFVLIVLAVSFALFFKSYGRNNKSPHNTFVDHVKNMKQIFPRQSENLWKSVRVSAFGIFNSDESKQPAIIIVSSSTLHASIASCLAKHISAGFESSWDISPDMVMVDINHLKHLDAASQKLQLDIKLNSAFSTHKRRSLIIENLQVLNPEAALLFYSYCDTDYAPFKDVMILLTLYFDEKEEFQHSRAVENYLENIWRKSLPLDKLKPLLSRVAGNIIIVKEEDYGTLSDLCS